MPRRSWLLIASLIGACRSPEPPSRRLVFDFEDRDEAWRVLSGDVHGGVSQRAADVHRHGRGFLGTGETRDGRFDAARHGELTSPPFVVDHDYLVFRAGGVGSDEQCFVELRRLGSKKAVRRAAATGHATMETHVMDVAELHGKKVRLRLVDRKGEEPCTIQIDWVRLVDG